MPLDSILGVIEKYSHIGHVGDAVVVATVALSKEGVTLLRGCELSNVYPISTYGCESSIIIDVDLPRNLPGVAPLLWICPLAGPLVVRSEQLLRLRNGFVNTPQRSRLQPLTKLLFLTWNAMGSVPA